MAKSLAIFSRLILLQTNKMLLCSVFALILCSALQISNAAPIESGDFLSTGLEILNDIAAGKSLEESSADR